MNSGLSNLDKLYEGIRLLKCYGPTSMDINDHDIYIYISELMGEFDTESLKRLGWEPAIDENAWFFNVD